MIIRKSKTKEKWWWYL